MPRGKKTAIPENVEEKIVEIEKEIFKTCIRKHNVRRLLFEKQ